MKENFWAYVLLWEYRQPISKQLYGWTYGNKFSGKKTTFIRKKEVLCREFQEGLVDEGAFEGKLERSEE